MRTATEPVELVEASANPSVLEVVAAAGPVGWPVDGSGRSVSRNPMRSAGEQPLLLWPAECPMDTCCWRRCWNWKVVKLPARIAALALPDIAEKLVALVLDLAREFHLFVRHLKFHSAFPYLRHCLPRFQRPRAAAPGSTRPGGAPPDLTSHCPPTQSSLLLQKSNRRRNLIKFLLIN